MDWYRLADIFFLLFHSLLILFNTFGWIFRSLRPYNLLTLLLTAFSWFILGIWYGWGYCFCTDWHWQIRQKLGYKDDPNSYIKFLIDSLFHLNIEADLVNSLTLLVFSVSLCISFVLNFNDFIIATKKK